LEYLLVDRLFPGLSLTAIKWAY